MITFPYAGLCYFQQRKKIGEHATLCCFNPPMHRQPFKQLLADYEAVDPELSVTQQFIEFVEEYADCFERSLEIGHITGSAWIIDPTKQKALLVHHKKLGFWLQPGGHCDGDSDVARVAQKETREESGLKEFSIYKDRIYDLDIHRIPDWKDVPAHIHYDVRFLIHADSEQSLYLSEESNDIAWFDLNNLADVIQDKSVLRLAEKSICT